MKKIEAIIFDMDGTLYSFDEKNESQFSSSAFGKQINKQCIQFFQEHFQLSYDDARYMYQDFHKKYNGEVSLGLETEFSIDRNEYFAYTWNLDVEKFVVLNTYLLPTLQQLSISSGILTAAPRIWAEKVLTFMQIRHLFGKAFFTGDQDIRKPNPLAFMQLAQFWNIHPSQILAIGDQEETDILPAKSIGMKTLRIAKKVETQADFLAPDIISAIALLKQKGII